MYGEYAYVTPASEPVWLCSGKAELKQGSSDLSWQEEGLQPRNGAPTSIATMEHNGDLAGELA